MKFIFYGTKEEYSKVVSDSGICLCNIIKYSECEKHSECEHCLRSFIEYGGEEK